MSNETYNGWTNYPTWRVHLEMFDGMEIDEPVSPEGLREMAEEAIEMSENQLARDFAMAFLAGVNWHEMAEEAIEMSENQLARDFAMAFLAGVNWHEIATCLNECNEAYFPKDDEEEV